MKTELLQSLELTVVNVKTLLLPLLQIILLEGKKETVIVYLEIFENHIREKMKKKEKKGIR